MYAITSAEKGKTHAVFSCVSASGYVLPPMMVHPCKQSLPEKFKAGSSQVTKWLLLSLKLGHTHSLH